MIELQTGIKASNVSWHAHKHGWVAQREATNQLFAEIPLEYRAKLVHDNLTQAVENQALRMTVPAKTEKELTQQILSTKTVIESAQKLFNWNDKKSDSVVNIQILTTDYAKVFSDTSVGENPIDV